MRKARENLDIDFKLNGFLLRNHINLFAMDISSHTFKTANFGTMYETVCFPHI